MSFWVSLLVKVYDMAGDFLFLTRTKGSDYTLRMNSGENAGSTDEAAFREMLRLSGVKGTEYPFAELVNMGGDDFCLMAGGLQTGRKDRDGRPVRFTFMMTLGKDDAASSFMHLVDRWDDVEGVMRSCLDDEAYREDRIFFGHEEFSGYLKDYVTDAGAPAENCVMKWEKSSGEIHTDTLTPPEPPGKSRMKSLIAALVVMAAAVLLMLLMSGDDEDEPIIPPEVHALSEDKPANGYDALSSELELLSWDIHTRYMEAAKDYEDARDEMARQAAIMEEAGSRLAKISGDIEALKGIYSELGTISEDEALERILRLKSGE